MRALVLFESMFGNTHAVAKAVADGLSAEMSVDVVEVGVAPVEVDGDVDLLVVGGPTHAFGLSRPGTRQSAVQQSTGGGVSAGKGQPEWLAGIRRASGSTVAAAAFDTRVARPRMPGSAARAAERRLRRLGFRIATRAASFYVTGTTGPLLDGELQRARDWGRQLGSRVATTVRGRPAR